MGCRCNHATPVYSYRFSDGETELFQSTLKVVLNRKTERIYQCSICAAVWCASVIPGGGLYGDVEWINISLPHWKDHWYWKIANESKN